MVLLPGILPHIRHIENEIFAHVSTSSSKTETKNPRTLEAHEAKMRFFTRDTLTEICRRLVGHYFLLTQEEVQSWDSDPEEFSA